MRFIDREMGRSINQGRGLRFPCKDRTDEVNKVNNVFVVWPSIMDMSLRSFKTNNWSADNYKKQVTSTRCALQPAIQSGDTG